MLATTYHKLHNQLYTHWQQQSKEQLPRLAAILLFLLSALAIVIELTGGYRTYSLPTTAEPTVKHSASDAVYKTSTITERNLFGAGKASATSDQNLPETRLQLQLRGAFTSSNPELASAIIQGPDGESRSYRLSSTVYGQATLKEVKNDRIVLSRNGQLETLFFPEPGTSSEPTHTPSFNGRSIAGVEVTEDIKNLVRENMSMQEIKQAAKELGSASLTPEQRQKLIRQRLQDLRNRSKAKR